MKEQKDFLNLKKLSEKSNKSVIIFFDSLKKITILSNNFRYDSDRSVKHIKDIEANAKKLSIYYTISKIDKINYKINKTIVHFSKSEKIVQKYYESNNYLLFEKIYYELCLSPKPNLKIAEYINSILEKDINNPFIDSMNSNISTYNINPIDIKKLLFSGYFSDLALKNLSQSKVNLNWKNAIYEYFFYKNTI